MTDLKHWLVIVNTLMVAECGGPMPPDIITTEAPTTMEVPADASTMAPADATTIEVPVATMEISCPEVKGHLYFVLNGVTYQHNSTVSITQIGCFDRATGYDNADASLMCVTDQVNTNCCREQDGGNMGEWYFPNGSMIPRERESHSNFSRSGFLMQVRLNRKNEAMGPLGTYKCKVPRMDGCGGKLHMHVASVIIVLPVPSLVQSFCILTTWNAPPGPFDMYSGYDIRYYNGSSEVIFNVAKNRFFLLIVGYNEVAELGPPWDVLVQVRVRTDSDLGPWSLPVPLCDSKVM